MPFLAAYLNSSKIVLQIINFKYCIIDYIMNNNTDYKETYVFQSIYFLICIIQWHNIFNDHNLLINNTF